MQGQVDVVQELLSLQGVQFDVVTLDTKHRTVLTHAAISGSQSTLSTILKHFAQAAKAALDLPDIDGHTALHHACSSGHARSVQMLLDHGAAFCNPAKGPGLLALACSSGDRDMVSFALDRAQSLDKDCPQDGSDPAVQCRYCTPIEDTPIVHAFQSGSKQVVQLLLERRGHIDRQVRYRVHLSNQQSAACMAALCIKK
jgi:autotransporter translocation and assembly factor TamB